MIEQDRVRDRRSIPVWALGMSDRLGGIERRLARIEGGLALLAFALGVAATVAAPAIAAVWRH